MRSHQSICRPSWAIILFALSLTLALLFCFVLSPRLIGSGITVLDPDGYGSAGRVSYETGRFDSVTKAPLYPVLIALISYLTGGYHVWAIQTAQCLLVALTTVLLYYLFLRTLGEHVARWAGLACAVHPLLIWYSPRLWTETLLTFVLASLTLALVALLQKPTAWRALLCGILAAAAALSKGIALILIPLAVLVILIRFRGKAWRWLALFCLVTAVLIAPWTWRNWALTGHVIPIHTTGGYNFYLGNAFTRHWLEAPLSYVKLHLFAEQDIQSLLNSVDRDLYDSAFGLDSLLLRTGLEEISRRPSLILQKLIVQSLTFWYLAADAPKSVLTAAIQIPVALAALPGISRALRHRSWALVLLVPVVGVLGVSVVIFSFGRLSATVTGYLVGLALYGLFPERRPVDSRRPIPVLQAITRLIIGGAQETVMLIAGMLDRSDWAVEVVSGPQTGPEGSLIESIRDRNIALTIEPSLVREINPLKDLVALVRLARFIRRGRYALVHTNSSKAGILGRWAAWLAGTPTILHTVHGWGHHERQHPLARAIYIALEKMTLPITDQLIAVSRLDVEKGLQAGIGRHEDYVVIRSGIELGRFGHPGTAREETRAQLGLPRDAPVVGSVTRLSPQKAPLDFVRAVALVHQDIPDAWFVMVGDGPLRREVETLAADLGLSDRLILTGLRRDIPELMAALDIFCLTSLWEGLPRVLPQAMATGLPIVATAVDGNTEAVLDGVNGILVPPADPRGVAQAIVSLLRDSSSAARMGAAGRERAAEFSAHKMVTDIADLYRRLLSEESGA
jgi:glycosyltransferase involved in cell wall biosynthesis/MFS family permease